MIKATGSEYYLKMADDPCCLIEGTGQKDDAAVFTFVFPQSNSTEEPYAKNREDHGFYLRCRSGSNCQHFYLTATCANALICPQRTVSVEEQAMFFLVHPGTRKLEKVSSWKQQESLYLVRHHTETGWLNRTIEKKYLLLEKLGTTSPPVLKEKRDLNASDTYCLFSIELL